MALTKIFGSESETPSQRDQRLRGYDLTASRSFKVGGALLGATGLILLANSLFTSEKLSNEMSGATSASVLIGVGYMAKGIYYSGRTQ